jgi:hypothetical protein
MSDYQVILNKDKIKLLKKKNNFKIEINFTIDEKKNDIINKFQSNEIFKVLKLLNDDIIENVKIDDTNRIIMILNNFENNDDFEEDEESMKYYLSFTTKIINEDKFSICMIGLKNSTEFIKDKYKKLDLEKIEFQINHDTNNNNVDIIINIKYNGKTLPIYMEDYIGLLFVKIFKRLGNYYK